MCFMKNFPKWCLHEVADIEEYNIVKSENAC